MLVAVLSDSGVRDALVGQEPFAVVLADADQFAFHAEGAAGSVVEGVALEAAGCDEIEADRRQL